MVTAQHRTRPGQTQDRERRVAQYERQFNAHLTSMSTGKPVSAEVMDSARSSDNEQLVADQLKALRFALLTDIDKVVCNCIDPALVKRIRTQLSNEELARVAFAV